MNEGQNKGWFFAGDRSSGELWFILILFLALILSPVIFKTEKTTEDKQEAEQEQAPKEPLPLRIDNLIRRVNDQLVFVKGGEFLMGYFSAEIGETYHVHWLPDEDLKPVHRVRLSDFFIGKYEVTFQDFDVFMEATDRKPIYRDYTRLGDQFPASGNWEEARDYCRWLREITGRLFDLPTEAQWEYAGRSRGQEVVYGTYNGKFAPARNLSYAWVLPVGSFPPNPLGLYDMTGNGLEWVKDWYDPEYYKKSPVQDPQGPKTGVEKVQRGGRVIYRYPYKIKSFDLEKKEYVPNDFCFRCVVNEGTDKR